MGVLLVAGGLLSCSGGGLTGTAPAQAVVAARFDIADNNDCNNAGTVVNVGSFGETPPLVVKDGEANPFGVSHIACRVVSAGGDRLGVEASFRADERLLFEIKGTFPSVRDVNGFKADRVTVGNGRTGAELAAFTQADGQCHVVYTSDQQGTETGRVWADVTCARAVPNPAEGPAGAGTCITVTQFRFENCALE